MRAEQVNDAIAGALTGRLLLEHPFYRRWEAGELAPGELAAYAEQYRYVERALPELLRTVAGQLPVGPARDLVIANLADEEGVPEPHTLLFESFAEAVGATTNAPAATAATALVELELAAAGADPIGALAMIAAYELQASAIADTKSAGLREHYGVDADGTRFWDVHAAMEADHATWSIDALALLATDGDELVPSATAAAEAWWAFLDEREALAAA